MGKKIPYYIDELISEVQKGNSIAITVVKTALEQYYTLQEHLERLNEISREIGKLKKERKSILNPLKTRAPEPKLEPQKTLTIDKPRKRNNEKARY